MFRVTNGSQAEGTGSMVRALIAGFLVVDAAVAFGLAAARYGGTTPAIAAYVMLAAAGTWGASVLWNRSGPRVVLLIAVVAIVARGALLPLAPLHSNDVYRYLWDGRLIVDGQDPYNTTPSSAELAREHAAYPGLYEHIDRPTVPTMYPPLDLGLFALAALVDSHDILGIKAIAVLGDLAALGLILVALRRAGLPLGRAALYAWSPLVITEFAHAGHAEGWVIAALVASLAAFEARRPFLGALGLAVAVLAKIYPLALIPIFFNRFKSSRFEAIAVALVVAGYAPFYLWHGHALGFLGAFALSTHFNDSFHIVLGNAGSLLVFAGAVFAAALAGRRGADRVALTIAVVLAYLLLAPSVFPWYLTVFVALLPLAPGLGAFAGQMRPLALALVAWTLLVPVVYATGDLVAPGSLGDQALHAVEYAPFALALAAAAGSWARTRLALAATFRFE